MGWISSNDVKFVVEEFDHSSAYIKEIKFYYLVDVRKFHILNIKKRK